jgi:hypothetical protein
MAIVDSSKERLLHLLYPTNGVRCAASQAKAHLSTECNDSLFVAVRTPIFAIALGRITTAQHLLNHTAAPLTLWVLAQETLQVIPKDLPELVQREPWSDRHYGDFSTL